MTMMMECCGVDSSHHKTAVPVIKVCTWAATMLKKTAVFHLNVTAQMETHQTWQYFTNVVFYHFGEPVKIILR